jgi:hypothetical protein
MRRIRPAAELEYIDADGETYPLSFPNRQLTQVSGLGMPPIQHWTTRAPFQHGRSHWGYAWQPRVITLTLYLRGCDRADMYAKRMANMAMLSPANGEGKLRLVLSDNHKYELHNVWFTGGYELSSQEQPEPAVQMGGLQLTAYDPFWKWTTSPLDAGETRDAEGRTCVETSTFVQSVELDLPFVGPFLLGTTVSTATLNCTNDGGEATKPVITVEGPTDDFVINNPANSTYLSFDGYSIAAGEVVTFDIPDKTITNAAGDNLITYVGGNFGTFELEPGLNALAFESSGSAVNLTTTVSCCWYVELVGV